MQTLGLWYDFGKWGQQESGWWHQSMGKEGGISNSAARKKQEGSRHWLLKEGGIVQSHCFITWYKKTIKLEQTERK